MSTVNSKLENVNGSYREVYYNLTITGNGDTLVVNPMKVIRAASWDNPGAVTSVTYSGNTVTFVATGAATFNIRFTGK